MRATPNVRRTAELAEMKKQLEKHALDVEVLTYCLLSAASQDVKTIAADLEVGFYHKDRGVRRPFSEQSVLWNARRGGDMLACMVKVMECSCQARCQG